MKIGNNGSFTSIGMKKLLAMFLTLIMINTVVVIMLGNVGAVVYYGDDMESGINGWTTDGLWHQTDDRYHSFNHSWVYNDGTDYETGARNWGNLTSPIIDLTSVTYCNLSFWTWHETEEDPTRDQMWVQISENGGPFFDEVQLDFSDTDWVEITINISAHKGYNIQIRFFFDTIDDSFNNFEGWYIDDVEVSYDAIPPQAEFSPPYSEYGLDTDGDGYFNYLVVNVSVNVDITGNYEVKGRLLNSSLSLIDSDINLTSLSTGIQVVRLYFDGMSIYNNSEDGTFTVELQLFNESTILLDLDNYTTSSYFYNDFQPAPAAATATATGPVGGPTNIAAITITYTTTGSPASVDLWNTTDTTAPYTWTFIGTDITPDGSYPWTVPADGSYGWFANSTDELPPTTSDAPEASYYIYDGTSPEVIITDPANATIGVPLDKNIVITFNETMDTGTFLYTIEPTLVGLSEVWSVGDTIVNISHANFAVGTRYWVNITAITDLAGNDLNPLPYSFYFDTIASTATVTGPVGGPTNIAAITITYTTISSPTSVDLWYTTNTTSPYTWIFIGTDLTPDGSYLWTVPADGSYGWFANSTDELPPTTSDAPEASYYIYDGTPPEVVTTDPGNGSTGVQVDQNIVITFNETMDTGTFIYTIEPSLGGLLVVWSALDTVVTISHDDFAKGTKYWVNITAVTDLAGNNLNPLPYSFYFDTVVPATATATGPVGGPTNVAGIIITYTTTGSPTSVDLYYTTDTSSPYTWIFIDTDSPADGSYSWTVPADGSYGWFVNSTDEPVPTMTDAPEASYYIYDGTPPEVETTDPANGSTGVLVNQNIVITFNETMNTTSFVYTIEPSLGGLTVVWSVLDTVVTISHDDFVKGTRYWVNITAVTDLAGNNLNPLPYSFYFDTVPFTTATATGPVGGPTNVAGITITYLTGGSPASVDLYYTTDMSAPYTWTLIGTDAPADGNYPWTIPADGSYGWFAKAPDEAVPTPTDAPEASYYIYDGTPPEVVSTVPANGSTGVLVNKDIEIVFNETMINITFVYTIEPNPGGLSVLWKAGNTTVEISHDIFMEGTRYWINITAVTDLAGNNLLPLPYSFYFDTETTPTTATATGPIGGPTNIAGITITYTTTGSPTSVDLYYTTDTSSPYTWIFIDTDSPADGSYSWTVPADGSYGWFVNSTDELPPTTLDAPEASYYIYDSTPPEVVSTNPINASIGIPVSQNVVITFNETMNKTSFTYTIEPNPGGLLEVWSIGDTVITISHTDFDTGTRYWVNITAAQDLAGNNLNPLPYSFYFDTVSNAATATGPTSGPTNVALISITYNTINNPSSVDIWFTTNTTAPYTWTFIGRDSPADGSYLWTIPADGSYGWFINSTDEPIPTSMDVPEASYYIYDSTPPEVLSTNPTNATTGITVNQNVVITFNESMNNMSLTYTIEPNPGGLTGVWSIGDTVFTISHTDFDTGTRYWVNITAAQDLAGNNLDPLPYSFYFDTVSNAATATGPIGGSTNVASITITYSTMSNPPSVDLWYTTDTTAPYTWTFIGRDSPADGSYPWTVPVDGSYGWFANSTDEGAPTPTDAPEASYYIYDGTSPEVQSTDPPNGSIGIVVNQDIIITFNETMNITSFVYTIEPSLGGLTAVWSGLDTVVTISHDDFAMETRYWVNITAVTDLAGNNLNPLPYSFYFDTEKIPTTATATGPFGGPTNVAAIMITYSITGSPPSVDIWYTTDITPPFTWTFIGRDSPADGSYPWAVPVDGSYGWFVNSTDEPAPTTINPPEAPYYIYDSTPPTVLSTNPVNTTSGIPVNQNVIITFNETMNTSSFIYTIEPGPGGLLEAWSVGDTVVTISHTDFAIGTRYWVNITAAQDLAGNSLDPLPYSFYFDTAINAATATGPVGGPTNVASITITYNTMGSPSSVDLWYTTDNTAPFTWTFIGRDSPADGSYPWSLPSDGSYGWFVNSTYEPVPTSSNAPEASFYIYDSQPPMIISIILSDPSPTKAGTVTFTITFNENMNNITAWPLVTFGLASPYNTRTILPISYSGNVWIGNYTIGSATGDGFNTISVSLAEDLAGNVMIINTSFTFVIDTIPPTSSVLTLPEYQNILTFDVPYTADDGLGSGVDYVELYYRKDGGPFTKYGTTFVSSPISFTATGEGFYEFYTIATDLAGNIENDPPLPDASTTIDTTPPEISSIVLSSTPPLKAGTVTFTITFNEEMNTITALPLVTFGLASPYNTHTILPVSYSSSTWVGDYTIGSATGDGINTISVSLAEDLAGNQMAINTSYKFEIDATLPTSSVVALPQYQNSMTFDIFYNADDGTGSGIQYVELYYSTDGINWNKYGTTFTSSPISFTSTAEGLHEFYTIATDNAGNVESAPTISDASTTVDITVPTIVSLELSPPSPTKAGPVTFTITFSEYMEESVFPAVTFGLDSPYNAHIINRVQYDEDTWLGIFTINSGTGDGLNTISVSGAQDLAGNQMLLDNSHTFVIDTTPPTIIVNTPTGVGVTLTSTISITFSEAMNYSSVESAFSYTDGTTTWTVLNCSVSWNVNTITLNPDTDFSYGTQYSVTIDTTAKDITGNILSLPFIWSFTTIPQADTRPPMVSSVSVTGTDVKVTTTVSIAFDEPMDHTSVENSITISPYETISGFSWDGNTIIITFESNLRYNTEYTMMVGTGAKDLAGNSLEEPYSWQFTTEAKPEEEGFPLWLIILIIVIIIVVLLVFLLIRSKSRKEKYEEPEEMEEIPEKIEEEKGAVITEEPLEEEIEEPEEEALEEEIEELEEEVEEPEEEAEAPAEEEKIEGEALFKCPECGTFVGPDLPICPNCGALFETEEEAEAKEEVEEEAEGEIEFECPECGAPIKLDLKAEMTVCPVCGAEFEVEEIEEEE